MVLLAAVLFTALSLFSGEALAEQATNQGRQALQEHRAKLQTEKPRQAASHSKRVEEKRKEAAEDQAIADQIRKLPQDQRERAAREFRTKRAEQKNKTRRAESEAQAASEKKEK